MLRIGRACHACHKGRCGIGVNVEDCLLGGDGCGIGDGALILAALVCGGDIGECQEIVGGIRDGGAILEPLKGERGGVPS